MSKERNYSKNNFLSDCGMNASLLEYTKVDSHITQNLRRQRLKNQAIQPCNKTDLTIEEKIEITPT